MKYDLASVKLKAADVTTIKPTKQEEDQTRDGMAFLVVKAPFFAHLLYNELQIKYTRDPRIATAATDALTIFVNPDFFATLKINERAFVLAHEVSHGFLGDLLLQARWADEEKVLCPSGIKEYDPAQMNRALDYRINAMLNESKVGKMPDCGLFDASISAKGFESGVEIYDKTFRKNQSGGGYGIAGQGTGKPGQGGGFDVHLAPSKQLEQDVASGKRSQAIVAAVEAARASGQGVIPGAVSRLLGEILDPKVSWQDFLRSTMLRKGGDPTYDWRYLDRRLLGRQPAMYFARQAHSGAGTIVIGGDTSGSIDDAQIERFMSEMNGIVADLNPQTLIVMWCDAEVHRVDELEEVEDLLEYKEVVENDGGPGGGGGTSFVPVFEKVAEMGLQPDMLVYFTDTYGTFPDHEPDYPVIWASITPSPRVPWGEVVEVEL